MSDIEFVFVVGAGRSGTTLLASAVGSHPKVALIPETGILRRRLLVHRGDFNMTDVLDERRLERWSTLDPRQLITSQETRPLDLFLAAARSYMPEHASCALEKDPRLNERSIQVMELLPQSRFIEIVRDPLDVVESRGRADWSKDAGFVQNLLRTAFSQSIGRWSERILGCERYHRVFYSNFVNEYETQLKNVLLFLDLDWEPELVNNREDQATVLVAHDEIQWKSSVLEPIQDLGGQGYRTLSRFQIALAWIICARSTFDRQPPRRYELIGLPIRFALDVLTLIYLVSTNFRRDQPLRSLSLAMRRFS